MNKIISYSLWGKNPLYLNGAINNARIREQFYPDYNCRFYYDNSVPEEVIKAIDETGSELILMKPLPDVLGMYWRFAPFIDNTIDRFLVRDCDSIFTQREVNAVRYWEDSGKIFHIIRDCESHQVNILGGTFGAIPGCISEFDRKLSTWFSSIKPDTKNPRGLFHGSDQCFLYFYVWPEIVNNHIAHIRKGMGHLRYTNNDIELPDLTDGHYVGMVV